MDPQEEEKQNKILQRHQKDHLLLPFAGLNPEYMEMSEFASVFLNPPSLCCQRPPPSVL